MNWIVAAERAVPKGRTILRDVDLTFCGKASHRLGQQTVRMVESLDLDTGKSIRILTNNTHLGPTTIARIYRERWQIEIFFKTLKQHLKIKTFVGTSENALNIQIWTALIAVLAIKLLQRLAHFGWSLSNLVAMIRLHLFSWQDLMDWLHNPFLEEPRAPDIQCSMDLWHRQCGNRQGVLLSMRMHLSNTGGNRDFPHIIRNVLDSNGRASAMLPFSAT